MGVLDSKTVGVQLLKGKKGDRILKKYGKKGKKMPACAIIAAIPCTSLQAQPPCPAPRAATMWWAHCAVAPVEVVKGQLTGLPIPAAAEIVLEGEIDAEKAQNEGPFGEYTGYYTEELIKPIPKPALEVKRVYYRNNPILWETSVGRPVGDQHMLLRLCAQCQLWTELSKMQIPGIKTVYHHARGFGTLLGGHLRSADVSAATRIRWPQRSLPATRAPTESKASILRGRRHQCRRSSESVVGPRTRYNPGRGTQIINRGRSTPLDPAIGADENKFHHLSIIMDARSPLTGRSSPRRSS